MTWLSDLNAFLRGLNPPAPPPPDTSEEGRDPLPDEPTPSDCEGTTSQVSINYSGPASYEFANLGVVAPDSTGMQWVARAASVVASLKTSNGPYPSENQNIPYALRTNAELDGFGNNNDWIGYYIATGNAVLVDVPRARKVGNYQQICYSSPRRSAFFLVTKEPDVVYQSCKPGGKYAILGTYWPLYQAAQQRAGGLYGLGAFVVPPMPSLPAVPVPKLPSWFGTVPMPKLLQPWVAMVIPGYTKPTEQEVKQASISTGSVSRDIGIGTIAIVTLALGVIAYVVWTAKS